MIESRPPPIGVFDSGLGGLSVLREIVHLLPQQSAIYVADSGHCPYGAKSPDEIIARASAITDFLLARGAGLIVVACNTATIAAVEYLRSNYAIRFVGMEPAVKPAAALTRSGVIGVLATGAALAGDKLHRLIDRHGGGIRVITQPCPGLVECVEAGQLDTETTRALLRRYSGPLLDAGADTLVLGCTHYAFLRPALERLLGPGVNLLDTGAAVARRVGSLLGDGETLDPAGSRMGEIDWFTSGDPQLMIAVGSRLWGAPIPAQPLPTT